MTWTKPAAGATLDTSAALAQGLKFAAWFLEGSGASVADLAGGHDLAASGSPAWSSETFGPALTFDGVNDELTSGAFTLGQADANKLTIAAYVKTSALSTRQTVVSPNNATSGPQMEIGQVGGGTNGGVGIIISGAFLVNTVLDSIDTGWHLIVYVRRGSLSTDHEIWIDGVQQTLTVKSGAGADYVDVDAARYIGNRGSGYSQWLNGGVALVLEYDHDLTAAEIGDLTTDPTVMLTSGGGTTVQGAATLNTTASLGATGQAIARGSVLVSAAASLTASGRATARGVVTLPSTATLGAAGRVSALGQATLAMVGTLAARGRAVAQGATVLATTATLATTARVTALGAATLSTVTSIQASTSNAVRGAATLVVSASISAAGHAVARGQATLGGATTLSASGRAIAQGAGALASVASFSVTARAQALGRAVLDALASIIASGRLPNAETGGVMTIEVSASSLAVVVTSASLTVTESAPTLTIEVNQ